LAIITTEVKQDFMPQCSA